MIKPCPFCGDRASLTEYDYIVFVRWRVECDDDTDCGATGPIRETREEAMAAWNKHGGPNDSPADAGREAATTTRRRKMNQQIVEAVSEQVHETWRKGKADQGVKSRPSNPGGHEQMLPWAELHESVKESNRDQVRTVISALEGAGYEINKK